MKIKKPKKEKSHALFSASSAERWMNCGASIPLSLKVPKPPETDYARKGTEAHECLELLLKNGPHKQMATEAFLRKTHPTDMVMRAASAAQHVWKVAPKGAVIESESKSGLPHIHESAGGTTDIKIAEEFGTLHIMDFKDGNFPVEVARNPQLMMYALGEALKYDFNFERVELTVLQFRSIHEDGPVRTWETDIDDLREFEREVKSAVKVALSPKPPFVPNKKYCHFCPAASICPELSTKALEDARVDYAPAKGLITPRTLPMGKDLGQLLNALKKLDTWSKAVRSHAYQQAQLGAKIPGWKMVDKRAMRKWANVEETAEEARKLFGDQAFTIPQLISPAQVEKLRTKKMNAAKARNFVSEHSVKISSGKTLVSEDDDRDGIDQLALDYADPV